jgi:hypothetical protein
MDPESSPEAARIALEGVSFQEFLDQLFGTGEADGLLDGERPLVLHGQDITLTPEEAINFFAPASPSETDFASLVAAFEELKGGNIRVEGLIDDSPFQFMIAGRQLKLEGITLTQAEFDALVADLQALSGLHQAKVTATVDGQMVSINLQNVPGRVTVRPRDPSPDEGTPEVEASQGENRGRRDERSERAEAAASHRGPERLERVERPSRPERPEKPEKIERVERIERIERPEIERPGRGRN